MAFKVSMKGPTKVREAPQHASFVLGSRPPGLRSPRIKPLEGISQYGKQLQTQAGVPPVGGAGFGNTGQTGES